VWSSVHFLKVQSGMSGSSVAVRQAPLYLADDCCLVSDSTRRSLRSADVPTCVVPRTLGDRTLTAAGPRMLNSLPVQAIYSQTVVRQFPYVRRSYDTDTTPFVIQEARRTYDWRKYERSCAIQTSPTDCSDDSWKDTFFGKHTWTRRSVNSAMQRLRKTLTYLLTYLV